MKTIKSFLLLILTFTSHLTAQNTNMPINPKVGKCYVECVDENSKIEWKEFECELLSLNKEEVLSLQHKLKNLEYDVDITGCIDEKTDTAYIIEKKEGKKRARKKRKEMRKLKKESINSINN